MLDSRRFLIGAGGLLTAAFAASTPRRTRSSASGAAGFVYLFLRNIDARLLELAALRMPARPSRSMRIKWVFPGSGRPRISIQTNLRAACEKALRGQAPMMRHPRYSA